MATRKTAAKPQTPARKKLLTHFVDHDDQEAKDLAYGGQKADCKQYVRKDTGFRDHSIGGWSPDED